MCFSIFTSKKMLLYCMTLAMFVASFQVFAKSNFTCNDVSSKKATERIVGGWDTSTADVPWQLAVNVIDAEIYDQNGRALGRSEAICGASLIAPRWAITAAHCVVPAKDDEVRFNYDGMINSDKWVVRFRNSESRSGGKTQKIAAYFISPEYAQSGQKFGDIALLKFAQPFEGVGINDVIDYQVSNEYARSISDNACVRAVGWGLTKEGGEWGKDLARTLQAVDLPTVPLRECQKRYGDDVGEKHICAGYLEGGRDSCKGDSGGPLMISNGLSGWTLIGVTSWGNGCGRADGNYGVYTRVSSYADWIQSTIRMNSN